MIRPVAVALTLGWTSLFAGVGSGLSGPELEALVQRLRPYEESLTYRPPARYGIEELALTFRTIWQIVSGRGSGPAAGRFAGELEALAKAAHEAARFATLAEPTFVLGKLTAAPGGYVGRALAPCRTDRTMDLAGPAEVWIDPRMRDWHEVRINPRAYPLRPRAEELGITSKVATRTASYAVRALDAAERAQRLLSRLMRAFPLYRDLEWGRRP